jgi:endonuclease/exonuclease/phosphatase family metal-dependent hydrolase
MKQSILSSLALLLVAAMLTACTQQEVGHATTHLRVLSYNIHHGAGMDGKLDLERIARVIQDTGADLVALQEVDKGVKRTDGIDEPAVLAELTGMHAVFEKNIDFQGGEYGNAVLSRFPVEHYQNHHLPQSIPGEQRGMLEVHITVGGRPIVFFATHFDYHGDDGERLASAVMLKGLLVDKPGQTAIVAGDLNALPDSNVIALIREYLIDTHDPETGDGFTFPADKPDRRIDYILHNPGSGLRAVECRVIDEPVASDHRPLLTVIELRNE